jgi:hypothetical protein
MIFRFGFLRFGSRYAYGRIYRGFMGKKGRLTVAEDARVQVLGSIAERDGQENAYPDRIEWDAESRTGLIDNSIR